jgi:hypothetical protein
MTRPRLAPLALLVVSGHVFWAIVCNVGLAQVDQRPSLQVVKGQLVIRQADGSLQQITSDGRYKGHPVLSPDASRIAYHGRLDAYATAGKHQLQIQVVNVSKKRITSTITIPWTARNVAQMNWLDTRMLSVEGEGAFLSIVDVDARRLLQEIYGTSRQLSPDSTKLAYRRGRIPLYGSIPAEYESDHIQVALLADASPTRVKAPECQTVWSVYPDVARGPHFEQKRFEDINERHILKSEFAWSKESNSLAFVEWQRESFWLTVLSISVQECEVKVAPKRIKLKMQLEEPLTLEWLNSGPAMKLVTAKDSYMIDPQRGTVSVIQPQPPH